MFFKKKIKEFQRIINLFRGPKYSRKKLVEKFHIWRLSIERDPLEKDNIIIEGTRSQDTVFLQQWRWIIIQAVLWLIISFKFSFSPVINLMAFFTILNQFINNILIISKDKRQIFNTIITQEILSIKSLSSLLWETLDGLDKGEMKMINDDKLYYAPECEWTDIFIKLIHNEYENNLPYIQINIGHESSELIHPSSLGLVDSSKENKQNSLMALLKLFSRHSHFVFDGHSSQKQSIEKKIRILNNWFIIHFGERDIRPIVQNEIMGSWECFININDTTNSWYELEKERDKDMKNLLLEWVPIEKEREKVDQAAESYKMKGYEW